MTGSFPAVPSEAPGRRSAGSSGRGPDLTSVLAVLLPVLALAAALGVHAAGSTTPSRAPAVSPLTRVSVICPPGGDTGAAATLGGTRGTVEAQQGSAKQDVRLDPRAAATTPPPSSRDGLVVTGRDALAPGLLAGRFASPLAAADCRPPETDQWFTGVGAGARHDSVLELVDPDAGRALVDVTVLGHDGLVSAPSLRGVSVAGGQTVSIDLGRALPRRDTLALHVTTTRGRVSASLADSLDQLGGGPKGADWLAAQSAPSTTNLMLGLPAGDGSRTVVIANPSDDEAQATIKLISPQSVFAPEGVKPVTLPPDSVVRVPIASVLAHTKSDAAEAPIGVEVDSSVPTTSAVLFFVGGDLAHAVPLPALTDTGAALLPADPLAPGPGTKPSKKSKGKDQPTFTEQLVLAGASGPGVAVVTSYDSSGHALDTRRVALDAGEGASLDLPAGATLVTVDPQRTPVQASVLVSQTGGKEPGVTVVPVRQPLMTGLVPHVAPGRP